ncbi:ArsC/Spx/MgsR family protein [Herminiimonas aquatilis]|uniref:ArsC/Spx/MgsR family protein n=1 Tax=Herminiimonas aquatilis TaxID=345342 RepID=A0ABW2J5F1_9BURK
MLIIYHNPSCSKSRSALELAQQFSALHHIELTVIDYQKSPLTLAQLTELHQVLQSEQTVSVQAMLRDNEELFATLALQDADDAALLAALAAHPQLLQRPILRFNQRAVIARPVELANNILQLK